MGNLGERSARADGVGDPTRQPRTGAADLRRGRRRRHRDRPLHRHRPAGRPLRRHRARRPRPGVLAQRRSSVGARRRLDQTDPARSGAAGRPDLGALLLEVLADPNIASKEWVIRQYDHEVQAATAGKPLVGVREDGPADAAVLAPKLGSRRGLVLACGLNPRYAHIDPRRWRSAPSTRRCAMWWPPAATPSSPPCSTTIAGVTPTWPTGSAAWCGLRWRCAIWPWPTARRSSPARTRSTTSSATATAPCKFPAASWSRPYR